MIKYLKSDEYYNDQYDRLTIETLKAFETELIEKFKDCQNYVKVTSAHFAQGKGNPYGQKQADSY